MPRPRRRQVDLARGSLSHMSVGLDEGWPWTCSNCSRPGSPSLHGLCEVCERTDEGDDGAAQVCDDEGNSCSVLTSAALLGAGAAGAAAAAFAGGRNFAGGSAVFAAAAIAAALTKSMYSLVMGQCKSRRKRVASFTKPSTRAGHLRRNTAPQTQHLLATPVPRNRSLSGNATQEQQILLDVAENRTAELLRNYSHYFQALSVSCRTPPLLSFVLFTSSALLSLILACIYWQSENSPGQIRFAHQRLENAIIEMSYEDLREHFGGSRPNQTAVKDVVSSLPCVVVGGDSFPSWSNREVPICPICLDVFEEGQPVRMLPQCGHCYHRDCVDHWLLEHKSNCPTCRRDV